MSTNNAFSLAELGRALPVPETREQRIARLEAELVEEERRIAVLRAALRAELAQEIARQAAQQGVQPPGPAAGS
jgi:hypothetical protein